MRNHLTNWPEAQNFYFSCLLEPSISALFKLAIDFKLLDI